MRNCYVDRLVAQPSPKSERSIADCSPLRNSTARALTPDHFDVPGGEGSHGQIDRLRVVSGRYDNDVPLGLEQFDDWLHHEHVG
jgi:hypothetical protein